MALGDAIPNPPRKTAIGGQPHMLAYITPGEAGVLRERGGGVTPGGGQLFAHGLPAFFGGEGGGEGGEGSGEGGNGGTSGESAGEGPGAAGGGEGEGSAGEAGGEAAGNGDGEGAGGSPGDGNGSGNGGSAGDGGPGGGGGGGGDSQNGYDPPAARVSPIDPAVAAAAAARQRQLTADRDSASAALRGYFERLFGADSDQRRAQGFYNARSGNIIAGQDAALTSGVAGMAPELQASPLANDFARGIREQAAGDLSNLWGAAGAQNAKQEALARTDFDAALGRIGVSDDPWGTYGAENPKFQGTYNDAWAIPDGADPFNGIESNAAALPSATRAGATPENEAAATNRLNTLVTNAGNSARVIT